MYMETDMWVWGVFWELGRLLLSVVYLGCMAASGLRWSTTIKDFDLKKKFEKMDLSNIKDLLFFFKKKIKKL
jgi:hypothetical protein